MRAVVEAAGIKDILSKSMGSSNQINILKAAVAGLQALRRALGEQHVFHRRAVLQHGDDDQDDAHDDAQTGDHEEAVDAFLAKRTPQFKGD